MRVFGEQCYAHVPREKRKKLDDTGVKCFFLGYEKKHKAYRLLNANDGSIIISRSVTFSEHPVLKTPQKQVEKIFDIIGDEDVTTPSSGEVKVGTPDAEEAFQTPPMRAHQAQMNEI